MNKRVRIEVKTNCDLISFLISKNIFYDGLVFENGVYKLNINYDLYKYLSRRYNVKIVRYYGVSFIKNLLLINRYFIISLFIGFLLLFNLCNTIFEININCDNDDVLNKLNEFLVNNDFSIYKRIKDYDEINILKEKILLNINEIEWIEFNRIGCFYNIDVSLKSIGYVDNNGIESNIIASRDGVIKHIVVHSGEKIREENEYVKKGDIIISGSIYKGEELINKVESIGEVYAEVWYLVKVNVPLVYNESILKKKFNHYYMDIFGKKFSLIGQYNEENSIRNSSVVFDKVYFPFKIYKESVSVYEEVNRELDYDSALDLGVENAVLEIENGLDDGEYIISKNVLKKGLKSSKMYIEVFFKVYEDIGVTSNIFEKDNINEECDS